MKLREALADAAARLAVVSDTPRLDAEMLAAHEIGSERNDLLLRHLDDPVPVNFEQLVQRRLQTEPVAYIIGFRDFWSLRLRVAPGVLIPRPDSETLIEAALDHFRDRAAPEKILDLGTGSGALLLAALSEWPMATGIGIDRSTQALAIAQANAEDCGIGSRSAFLKGDWAAGLEGSFDLILCNPPYIADDHPLMPDVIDHEPKEALFAGQEGLDDYLRLAPQITRLLSAQACACVEIGYDQGLAAGNIFRREGLAVSVRQDLGGRDRCLVLTQMA